MYGFGLAPGQQHHHHAYRRAEILLSPFSKMIQRAVAVCIRWPVLPAPGKPGTLHGVDPNLLLLLCWSAAGPIEDQGDFELSITTTNECNTCIPGTAGASLPPAPARTMALSGGQAVQMCYVVN